MNNLYLSLKEVNKIITNKCNNFLIIKRYNHLNNEQISSKILSEPLQKQYTKLLKVAIIGVPNAGKSTLINNLMDRKVCPTSNKVHTTRKRSHAIFTENLTQIVILDTPGIVSQAELNRYNLEKSFKKDCAASLREANLIGVIHDVSNSWTQSKLDIKVIKLLEEYNIKNSFLVLNKIDTMKSKRKLLDITRILTDGCINSIPFATEKKSSQSKYRGWPNFSEVFMVSALTGDGVQEIKNFLVDRALPGDWMYPENHWTNHSPDDIILRTVQATLLDFLPQEIPYKLKTNMELFEITDNGKIVAVVLVRCPVERIQKLVTGVADGKLRQITEKAQKDLLHTFDQPVRLQIVVTTDK